ncbi:pyridoxamine 5'-phosphate oxidase [Parasediminibacterium sp. JCM 36343]|uniref:pyridoxamine 5'-phosphate oxidase n=1 Tax=Parasediminibacterium sp. JCM 36343 TaxID=3374279 RepID=UPI003978AD8B
MDIAGIRKDYKLEALDETGVAKNAIEQFSQWWEEAVKSNIEEVNAMVLATASKEGVPTSRIVLLKGFDANGFIFFTNYNSRKGLQMAENNHVSLLFFWKELERQVNIIGTVQKTDTKTSDNYFFSRPVGSRIGAWSSPQSTIIDSREVLEQNEQQYKQQFGETVPRPPHWGGYIVKPKSIEFWQGRSNRLHDRLLYSLQQGNSWTIERLAP